MTSYRHFDVVTTKEVESLHCFFVFGWIKLKFGVRGNFGLLISNRNSNAVSVRNRKKNATFLLFDHEF